MQDSEWRVQDIHAPIEADLVIVMVCAFCLSLNIDGV
jgi:hypothetical protein